jgi:hypothetical protein
VTASELRELWAPLAAGRGAPALVQSSYGTRGNLELVQADAREGLWVHWRNNDAQDVRPGALAGCWSAGLAFAGGRRFDDVALTQVAQGSPNIEVVATSGRLIHRTYWSAGAGFSDPVALAGGCSPGSIALVQRGDGDLVVAAPDAEGGVRLLLCDTAAYPALAVRELRRLAPELGRVLGVAAAEGAGGLALAALSENGVVAALEERTGATEAIASGCHAVALAAAGPRSGAVLVALRESGASFAVEGADGWSAPRPLTLQLAGAAAVTACRSTLGGGQVDIVIRTGSSLVHTAIDDRTATVVERPAVIETRAWIEASPEAAPTHDEERAPCRS